MNVQLRSCAVDIGLLPGIVGVFPMNGVHEMSWANKLTHLRVSGDSYAVERVSKGFGLLAIRGIRGGWDVLHAAPQFIVAHLLAVTYDSTANWGSAAIGKNLAYLSMLILQENTNDKVTFPDWCEDGKAFVHLMNRLFHKTHPLWDYMGNI